MSLRDEIAEIIHDMACRPFGLANSRPLPETSRSHQIADQRTTDRILSVIAGASIADVALARLESRGEGA